MVPLRKILKAKCIGMIGLSLKSPCMMKYVSGSHILSLWWMAFRNSYCDWFAYLSLGSNHCCWSRNSTSYFCKRRKAWLFNEIIRVLLTVLRNSELTKLDSSGDAKLNNNTLTFTVKVPTRMRNEMKGEKFRLSNSRVGEAGKSSSFWQ